MAYIYIIIIVMRTYYFCESYILDFTSNITESLKKTQKGIYTNIQKYLVARNHAS